MRGVFSDMNTKTVCVARERSLPARGSERRRKGHILRKMNHFTHLRKSSNQKHVCAKLYDYIITLIILFPFWYLNILYLFKWCFGPVVPERIFNFCIFAIIFPWKKDVTLHLKKKVKLEFPLRKWWIVPSLVENGLVVMEENMKMWKVYRRTDDGQ